MFENALVFNQDISNWDVKITEPTNFSNGSDLSNSNEPTWA
jgi:hypothetical protein